MNLTLEVVVVPVSDVEHAKAFDSEQLGFNVDHDIRVLQRPRWQRLGRAADLGARLRMRRANGKGLARLKRILDPDA